MINEHLPYWLAAMFLPAIGPRKLLGWLAAFPSIKALFHASDRALILAGVPEKCLPHFSHPNWAAVEKELQWLKQSSHHFLLTQEDPFYPAQLKEIGDAPLVLYLQGNPAILSQCQLAMVGARHATPAGLENAEQFAYLLAQAGVVITSGLALGIDGASHRGALAARGLTIGVAGTGLNHCYPVSHQSLVRQIIQQEGAVLSEFPVATPPHAMNFPRRNRIISGLSRGVLVVQAAIKSGSLITARQALEQNRDVFAIPGSIHHPLARGCHYLIKQGAKLVETAADILEEPWMPLAPQAALPDNPPERTSVKLDADCRRLLAHIECDMTSIDSLISRSGLTVAQVSSILLTLELQGCIQSVPGGYVNRMTDQ